MFLGKESIMGNTEKKKEYKELVQIAAIYILKIILMGLFSSDYQQKMFEPFISGWFDGLSHGQFDPYQTQFDNGQIINFPYPVLMLLIMSTGAFINRLFPSAPLFIHNVVFKLPLLVFDFLGYVFLKKLYPEKNTSYFHIYLLSPIILYSVFMHGQLDIIPMVLLFIALYYISGPYSHRNYILSVLFLAASTATKLHIAAVIPLILIYIYKRFGYRKSLIYALILCILDGMVLIAFSSEGFSDGVLFNSEIKNAFLVTFEFGELSLYLSLFAIGFIYLYIINLNLINKELLFTLCGVIFAVFLSLCFPMPAWYVWVVPFITVYMMNVNLRKDTFLVYGALNAAYLLYFVFFHYRSGVCDLYFCGKSCEFLKLHNALIVNICFTLLTCLLVWTIYTMHKFGITSTGIYRFHDKNFVIGICGDSGVGKSTIQQKLCALFPQNYLLVIEGDGDHKWERGDENWNEYTHLNPKANFLYRQAQDIHRLKNGESVRRVSYDHSTGKFTKEQIVLPKKFISISGLHTLYLPQLRENIDLKIFMEADEELRCSWKINRDKSDRCQSEEVIRNSIKERYDDAEKYILPQKDFADIIFHYVPECTEPLSVGMKIMVSTQVDIGKIIEYLNEAGVDIEYHYSSDFRYQIVEYHPVCGDKQPEVDFQTLYYRIVKSNYEITGSNFDAEDMIDGIQKLIILSAINEKMRFS